MSVTEVKLYESSDGTRFPTYAEAQEHELNYETLDRIKEWVREFTAIYGSGEGLSLSDVLTTAIDRDWDVLFNILEARNKAYMQPAMGSLNQKIADIDGFSTRVKNILINGNVLYVGDLVTMTEATCLRINGAGRKGIAEIKEKVLSPAGLTFDMVDKVPGWRRPNPY